MREEKHTFSTRDWLMMAALAALGGVTGTYVNAMGDLMQSILGFAGTTQWAAGLHVVWLTLAMGLTGRVGAGTVTGLLKGLVELLTGNTHGLLVVLIDLIAGLLVDAVFLLFRRKDRLPAYMLAGGLAAASNVFAFQLFAALPADMLAYGAMALVGLLAFASGVVFAGVLGWMLLGALRRAGVVRNQPVPVRHSALTPVLLGCAAIAIALFGIYLHSALAGPATISIGGAVAVPYDYPQAHSDIAQVTAEGSLHGVSAKYAGIPVRELLDRAQPASNADMLLIRAVDGYAFFVSMDEVRDNPALLLAPKGSGSDAAYDLVGAENSKAWVRGVSELTVVAGVTLEVKGRLDAPEAFDPNAWQFDMDAIALDVGNGPEKLQGAPLGKVLASMGPAADATEVLIHTADGSESLPIADVLGSDDVRLFTVIGDGTVSFVVARMDSTVIVSQVTALEVK